MTKGQILSIAWAVGFAAIGISCIVRNTSSPASGIVLGAIFLSGAAALVFLAYALREKKSLLEKAIEANVPGITISVHPDHERPGRNVRILANLLEQMGICFPAEVVYSSGWKGADYISCFRDGRRVLPLSLRIVDWAPEDGPWGGPSDNMLSVRAREGKTITQTADWIVGFLGNGGHEAQWESVSDGSIDLFCDTLFVSFKLNVRPRL
jgi:hypothetical protein